jgi:SHOCT-like domain
MSTFTDERNRILHMVETGQITAEQAAQLLDAMGSERERPRGDRARSRTVRIRVTNSAANAQKINLTATLPVSLIEISLRLVTRLIPQLSGSTLEDLLRSIEEGATGRLLDIQDLEAGERVEIFAE